MVWETTTSNLLTSADDYRDRAYFYGADGMLRASDVRDVDDPTRDNGPFRWSFEEYRYDALGRRVLVRARRGCDLPSGAGICTLGHLRRTVWDGDRELFEIQAPGGREPHQYTHMENDTFHIPLEPITFGELAETNAFYGRVLYVHGLSLDQPLGVVRMGYGDRISANNQVGSYRALGPFSITPHWNHRGQPVLGTFEDGSAEKCVTFEDKQRCVFISWPEVYAGYARPRARDNAWHGSLLQDKSDASGLSYRRNRYYDPASGRFTQEDPIGLAGGVNLYGFAAGDPVNYGDPYGLSSCRDKKKKDEECDDDRKADGVVEQHGRCEVAALLTNYAAAVGRSPGSFARRSSFPAEFDWKFGRTADDLFQVGSQWLRADEFGNYAAGYAGQKAGGWLGHVGVRVVGIVYASAPESDEHWTDRESAPMINAGAARARLEATNNGGTSYTRDYGVTRRPYVEPLTSRRGCN